MRESDEGKTDMRTPMRAPDLRGRCICRGSWLYRQILSSVFVRVGVVAGRKDKPVGRVVRKTPAAKGINIAVRRVRRPQRSAVLADKCRGPFRVAWYVGAIVKRRRRRDIGETGRELLKWRLQRKAAAATGRVTVQREERNKKRGRDDTDRAQRFDPPGPSCHPG